MGTVVKSHARSVKGKGNTTVKRHARKTTKKEPSKLRVIGAKTNFDLLKMAEENKLVMEKRKVKKHSREFSRVPIDEEILVRNSRKNKKLSAKKVDKIYKKDPSLEAPAHTHTKGSARRIIRKGPAKVEASIISIRSKGKRYKVLSTGKKDDTWHAMKKYGSKTKRVKK